MRIVNTELADDQVLGGTTYGIDRILKLNPGLSTVFPWLAPQAVQWEQYRVHKLVVRYIPIAPTSTQGDVILSPNYDASDTFPQTEAQAVASMGAVMSPCWMPCELVLDVPSMMALGPRKFVRNCLVAGDIKTFDVGTVSICTNNQTSGNAIGKILLDYDIEFFIPQLDPSPSTRPLYTALYVPNTDQGFANGVWSVIDFNTVVADPLPVGPPVGGVFTPAAGCYRVTAHVSATDSINEVFAIDVEICKNDASLNPQVHGRGTFANAGAGNIEGANVSCTALVPCNGTDTVKICIRLTGAIGLLRIDRLGCQVVFSLA